MLGKILKWSIWQTNLEQPLEQSFRSTFIWWTFGEEICCTIACAAGQLNRKGNADIIFAIVVNILKTTAKVIKVALCGLFQSFFSNKSKQLGETLQSAGNDMLSTGILCFFTADV